MKDYYKILGVSETASDAEIKKAYQHLSMKHHPDRPKGDHDKYIEIVEAKDTLLDKTKRRQYDMERNPVLNGHPDMHTNMPPDFNNSFSGNFGHNFESGFPFKGHQPGGFTFQNFMKAEDFFNGNFQNFFDTSFTEPNHSDQYPNRSNQPPHRSSNPTNTRHPNDTIISHTQILKVNLEDMYTGGRFEILYHKIVSIDGEKHRLPESITLKIPPKCHIGKTFIITIPPANEESSKQIITVSVRPHDHAYFRVISDSGDLETTVDVSFKDILLGFKIPIKGVDGVFINYQEEGVVNPKLVGMIPNGGYYNKEGKKGNLYVKINVKYPSKITKQQKKVLEQYF